MSFCSVSVVNDMLTFRMYLNSLSGVNVIREKGKLITSVYRKPTFSGVYTHFDSFLPDTYKIAMICTIVNRCFQIYSSWSMFHQQLILSREIFQENGYPENFIDRCFKLFLNRIHILKENVPAVEKKPLRLVLFYLGTISLQTRTELQKFIKTYVLPLAICLNEFSSYCLLRSMNFCEQFFTYFT